MRSDYLLEDIALCTEEYTWERAQKMQGLHTTE